MDDTPVSGVLYEEGVPTVDGRVIDAGALSFDLPMPIVNNSTGEIVGKVLQFACVEGEVSFEGVVFGEPNPNFLPALTVTDFSISDRDGLMHVVSGRAREVRLAANAAFEVAHIHIDGRSN